MSALRKALNYYRELKLQEKQKEQLLSADLNYTLLEALLARCANNPGLVIEINLKSGDKLLIKTKEEQFSRPVSSYIDGREVIE